jgi:hypothetical protein
MAKRSRTVFRQDSATETVTDQAPTTLSAEEEMLAKLAEKNTKFDRNEQIVPRLKILQPLSPEVTEGNNQCIEGAKPGMFYNTASGKLTPGQEGIIAVVIGHMKQTIEWMPREQGGGLVKIWGADEGWKNSCSPEEREKFNPVTKEGHTIDKQRSFLIYDVNPKTGETDPSFFNFRSTGNRAANLLATMLTQNRIRLSNGNIITPPFYYFTYKITLDKLSNMKGTWWSPHIVKNTVDGKHIRTKDLPNGDAIFNQAILMQEHFMEGGIAQVGWEEPAEDNSNDLNGDKIAF